MLIPPLYGNIQFVGIAENVFKRLLVFVLVFEDDFDCMVFVNQNAVNKGHQHTAVQLFDVFILLKKRYPVPFSRAGCHRLLHFFFDPQKRVLLVLNGFGVAVAELEVFRFINDAADEVLVKPQLELLVPFNLFLDFGDLSFVIESLTALRRKPLYHRKRVFQIDDKLKDGAWYAFYECSSSVKRGNLCTPHYTRQDKLEADVLAAIQLQVKAALNYDKLLAKLRNSEGERSIRDQQNALITSLNLKLSGISKKRTRLYEDFTEGILDEEEYVFAKKAYDEQYADLSRRLDEAVQRKVKFAEAMSEDNKWLTLMKSVSGATMLSHELVDESVELVKVHEDGSIELVMKYGDIYALTVQSIKEVQEAM